MTVSTFEEAGGTPLTRIEIVMSDAGIAQVEATSGGLEIRVIPGVLSLGNVDVSQNWGSEAIDDTPVTESRQTVEDDADQTEVAFPASLEEAPIVVVKSPPAATQNYTSLIVVID